MRTGKPPADGGVIKLNTNENPYPPHDAVVQAIRSVPAEALRLYPPAAASRFRGVAAGVHGLDASQVIATNGGDELLRLLVTCYCEPGGHAPVGRGGIGVLEPTYSLYPVLAAIHDCAVTAVPRGEGYALPDPAEVAAAWNDAGCRVGFVVNPHAPSGRLEPVASLAALAACFRGLLVVDEAYVDFAERDAVELLTTRGLRNVLLLRSLSKGYALAGLRFGYGLADAAVIATLDKARDSYNTDVLSQHAATAALEHRDAAAETWAAVKRDRAALTAALRQRGWAVADSQSNFILCTPPGSNTPGSNTPGSNTPGSGAPGARSIYEALKAKGILIRYFKTPGLDDKLRISIGTPAQHEALLHAIDNI